MNERIPRREAPDFRDSEDGLISSIIEDGFLNVALDDANQYGPHAMIVLLGIVSVLTGSILGLAMIDPMLSAGAIALLLVASILQSRFRFLGD
ncbi:MAG: hypothetical protein CMA14_03970 [Euryarchaeota archaeon]|nr:hypothetical protein [Euryarchaeota archaeon]OUW78841.1 MAG: hypothetical protein CBD75_02810 [Euryarchaeota archaeon TMED215]|tara:strand:+ start:4164 stop:4442 length:279 start_codon:yes stop_codon:yes gene_type:complete